MKILLPFGPVADEVAQKLASMHTPPDGLIEEFIEKLSGKLGASATNIAQQTLDHLKRRPSASKDHPSMRTYLAHPIRVANFVLAASPDSDVETILIALLHNLFEVSGLAESDLRRWGLAEIVPQRIRLLTIDRSREADISYLMDFYAAIEAAGEGLALVRCMDKIDNLFGAQIIDNPKFRMEYIELADRFLSPIAMRLEPSFGRYFGETCAFARYAPYLGEKKRQITEFLISQRSGP